MMKKVYELPITSVIEISTSVILAGSAGVPNAQVDPDEDIDADKIESRRHNDVWDDDEEEDDQ
jgi:hypothetical protein